MNPKEVLYLVKEQDDQTAFLRMARDKGFTCKATFCRTIKEARDRLSQSHFDIVIADFQQPEGQSTELLGTVPIIFLTSSSKEQFLLRALELGAYDCLDLAKDPEQGYLDALPLAVEKTLHLRQKRENELAYRAFFDRSACGNVQADPQTTRILRVNPKFCEITGYSAQELTRMTCLEITHPEDRESSVLEIQRLVRGEANEVRFENRYVRKDGQIRWAQLMITVTKTSAGQTDKTLIVAHDITERKRTEQALQGQELQQSSAYESTGVGTFVWDIVHDRITWGPELERLHGLPSGKFRGRYESWAARVYPEDLPSVELSIKQSFSTGHFDGEWRVAWPDGTIRWIAGRGTVKRDIEGHPLQMVGVNIDITDRKQSQEVLQAAQAQLQLITDTMAVGVTRSSRERRFLWVSPAYAGWLQLSQDEIAGKYIEQIIGTRAYQTIQPYIEKVLAGRRVEFETELDYRGTGLVWIHAVYTPTFDVAGVPDGWVSVIVDITDRKRAELESAALRDQLARVNTELEQRVQERTVKLRESIGELERFSYALTHDMRAPLRAMRGFAELLTEECKGCLSSSGADYLKRIATSADRMDQLIIDALDYSKAVRQEVALRSVNADALLRGMLESYPAFQSPNAEIQVHGQIPQLVGNPAALTQCFSNLLSNAIKFVRPGVVPKIDVWAEERDGFIRVWFKDNGIGIPKNCHDRIFDMFQQVNRGYEGTGIGLSLVRKVIERMGGMVGVQSEPGKGSRFWFELKVAPRPQRKKKGEPELIN